jgi:Domain of unknown function (DUF1824)
MNLSANLELDLESNLTVELAESILRQMSDLSAVQEKEAELSELNRLRTSLLFLQQHSEFQIFGICAPNAAIAWRSLKSYLNAFEYDQLGTILEHLPADLPLNQPLYLKYNSRSQKLHQDIYLGKFEGVLISYHSNFSEEYNGTHGHFPLDLW